MPKNISLYKIFLASPSDIKAEREIARKIVDNFNNIYSHELNARIELKTWETHTYPSIGEYPQDVINSQINNDYDIFLGILWTRFGSKTLKYDSGTEEEFHKALELNKERPSDIKIMMYFNTEGIPLNSLDLDQYTKVVNFKNKIGSLGCYYREYNETNQFEDLFREHLYLAIKDWNVNCQALPQKIETVSKNIIIDNEKENSELGYWEYKDLLETKAEESTKALKDIEEATAWIGKEITERTNEFNGINASNTSNSYQIKASLLKAAKVMNQYSIKIELPIQNWICSYEQMINAFKGMLNISDDFLIEAKDLNYNKEELEKMIEAMDNCFDGMKEFHSSINRLPRISQPIIIAKKAMSSKIKMFLDNIENGKLMAIEVNKLIDNKIKQIESIE